MVWNLLERFWNYVLQNTDCDPSFIGDYICDDKNNNEACDYDGLDCCGNTMESQFYFCTVCECKVTFLSVELENE